MRRASQSFSRVGWLVVASSVLLPALAVGQTQVLWREGFEVVPEANADWHADQGGWEMGKPNIPVVDGANCAKTVLDGNMPEGRDTRLIRHKKFTVPEASANPRLRFWHWFNFGGGDGGRVELRVSGGAWQPISEADYTGYSSVWSQTSIDLSPFAGSQAEIAFYFWSRDCCFGDDTGPGWAVDDVEVVMGPIAIDLVANPVDFENGQQNWWVGMGVWEVGTPTAESGFRAHGGLGMASTVLSGNAYEGQDSRFVSPPIVVPSAGDFPRLRFWHWFNFGGGDGGRVEVRVNHGEWEKVSTVDYAGYSSVWTRSSIDLSPFADQTVEIAFYFWSRDCCFGDDTGPGWYLDDIEIVTGPIQLPAIEDFENPRSGWWAERGLWEDGVPTSGPGAAYSGQRVMATVLDGNTYEGQDSRLVSPPFTVATGNETPALRFFHWFAFGGGDSGWVEARIVGGEWERVSDVYSGSSGAWTFPYVDLSKFAGERIEIAFYFQSRDCCFGDDTGPGWYIDLLSIPTGDAPTEVRFKRGDANGDGQIDLSDSVKILVGLFLDRSDVLSCAKTADADDSGSTDISDALLLLNFLFLGERAPAGPFPGCGIDPTADEVSCESYFGC